MATVARAPTLAALELAPEGPETFKKHARFWRLRPAISYLKRPRGDIGRNRTGHLNYWLNAKAVKSFGEDWDKKAVDEQTEIYEALRAKVEENRVGGWTSRL